MSDVLSAALTMENPQALKPHPVLATIPPLDPDAFEALITSIKQRGILKPITLSRATGEIVDGLHRWKASLQAGLFEVPCVYTDKDAREFALESAVTGRRLTKSGLVLWLWEQHPLVSEARQERRFSNLKKGRFCRCDSSHIGENGDFSRSYQSLADQYKVPREYFQRLEKVRLECRHNQDWAWVRNQVLYFELSWTRASSALAGKQTGVIEGEDGEVKRCAVDHYGCIHRALRSIRTNIAQWGSLTPDQRADVRETWLEIREMLPPELKL